MKINKKKIIKFSLIIIWIILFVLCFVNIRKKANNNNNNAVIAESSIKNTIQIKPIVEETIPETYTTMYSTAMLNIRQEPHLDTTVVNVVEINTEFQTVDGTNNNGWVKVKIDDNYYYVASEYLSKEKVKIVEQPKVITPVNNNNNNTVKQYSTQNNTGVLTKSKGVNYYNGHKETWYSQRVLPGGGLKIPGRHVDSRGLVCDKDGYICVASSDYAKGTVVQTSLGAGKVYDCGCAKNTIDIYTD